MDSSGIIIGGITGIALKLTPYKIHNNLLNSIAIGACFGLVTHLFLKISVEMNKKTTSKNHWELVLIPATIFTLPFVAKKINPISFLNFLESQIDTKQAAVFVGAYFGMWNLINYLK